MDYKTGDCLRITYEDRDYEAIVISKVESYFSAQNCCEIYWCNMVHDKTHQDNIDCVTFSLDVLDKNGQLEPLENLHWFTVDELVETVRSMRGDLNIVGVGYSYDPEKKYWDTRNEALNGKFVFLRNGKRLFKIVVPHGAYCQTSENNFLKYVYMRQIAEEEIAVYKEADAFLWVDINQDVKPKDMTVGALRRFDEDLVDCLGTDLDDASIYGVDFGPVAIFDFRDNRDVETFGNGMVSAVGEPTFIAW